MTYLRDNLPEPVSYFESEGQILTKRGKWRTTNCTFCGGSDPMRINTATGAWVCMSCGKKGGDVLAHHMAAHGLEFIDAAKALGAWQDDGKPYTSQKPKPLPPSSALSVLAFECTLIAIAAGNIARGVQLTATDLTRVMKAAGRVNSIKDAYQ